MLQVQAGSHHAFSILIERHLDKFFRIAYRMTNNPASAEDLVQESLIRLWERPDQWQAAREVKFTTWFYRVIINRCLNFRNTNKPEIFSEEIHATDNKPAQDEELMLNERQLALEKAIANLPARQRTSLNLCFYEGVSHQEAADILGVKLKALQSLLMRAKQNLKKYLRDYL